METNLLMTVTFKAARSDKMEKPTMITAESVKGLSEKWIS